MNLFKSRPIQPKRPITNVSELSQSNEERIKRIKAFVRQPTPANPVPLYQQLFRKAS